MPSVLYIYIYIYNATISNVYSVLPTLNPSLWLLYIVVLVTVVIINKCYM